MRFSLRSPDWWWIMPLTLLVHVVIADPFDNHHRRQTSPNNVLDLIVKKGNVYDLDGMPQMPRGGPGGPTGGEDIVIVNRDLAGGSELGHEGSHNDKRFNPYVLLEEKESTDQEINARLFLNSNAVDHGKHIGHGAADTKDKRLNEPALTPMDVAARDGKLKETVRIEYLKKRGLGQVSRCEKRIQS